MDFTGIGKIGSFAKQKNLIFAANYKIKTGQSIVTSNGTLTLSRASFFNQVQTSKKTSSSMADKARLASIKQKLKSGKKLSTAEMNYLKEKDPSTYKKAKYADDAREELKVELKNAKTKQEARQAVMRATAKIAADCAADFEALKGGAGGSGGGLNFGGDINFGANMNFGGGDAPISMNVDAGAGAENISVDTQNAGGEISGVANAENISNENPAAQNENALAQGNNFQVDYENSDGALDILDKYIYAIRAIQEEWLNFTKSDEYKELPEDIFEEMKTPLHKEKNFVDAILAYKKVMEFRLEE